jgi:hypothetical protein
MGLYVKQRRKGRLVTAILTGTAPAVLRERLGSLEARKADLEWELATTEAPARRLHPNLAQVYRQCVAQLSDALSFDDGAEAREIVRGPVEEMRQRWQGMTPDQRQELMYGPHRMGRGGASRMGAPGGPPPAPPRQGG